VNWKVNLPVMNKAVNANQGGFGICRLSGDYFEQF